MDYKWYFAFISLGCMFITIAPLQENQWPLLICGVLIVISSALAFMRKSKADKKADNKTAKKKER